jgi:hypothetical protein
VAAREPELAALAAQAIAICSQADYFLGKTLIDMLGPRAAPAFAMYEAIGWGYSRKRALKAAAAMVLSDADNEIFDALLRVYAEDEGQRNKFAHWLWVHCKEAPGYLILLDPVQALRSGVAMHVAPEAAATRESTEWIGECSCYSKPELQRIVARFSETLNLIEAFRNLVGSPGLPNDQIRDFLMNHPRMRQTSRHRGKPTQTPPSAPPEPLG